MMTGQTGAHVGRTLLAIVLVWATACLDSAGPVRHVDPLPDSLPDALRGLVVSPPVAGSADSGAAGTLSATGAPSGVLGYVSLVAGTVPSGLRATIRHRAAALSLRQVPVVDGGFDPVAIPVTLGDTLLVEIERAGDPPLLLSSVVRSRRRPVVVRTSPPPGGRDVPLNAAIVVVFSQPVDGSTVTPTSVQLLRGSTPVEGTVRLLDPSGLFAVFEPAQQLVSTTSYRLAVAQTVRDRNGDALEAAVTADFTTGSGLTGAAASVTVSPDFVEEFFPVTMTVTAYVHDASGNVLLGPTVQWTSSDTSVAVVRPALAWWQTSGREAWLTLRAGGVATITATSGGLSDTIFVRSRPISGEVTGSLGVTTATTGTDFDPNGYSFIVAGAGYQRTWWVSANGSATLDAVPVGDYSVTLINLGSRCAVTGANPQTVTITAGAPSEIAFAVSCSSAVNGSVRLTTVTTGEDFDSNGYWVQVPWDPWGEAAAAPANGSILFPAVPAGQVGFALYDVASNCAVVGGERKTVTVAAGDTSDLTFAVTCAAIPSLRVTIATTGTDVDPDGYRLDVFYVPCGSEPWQCGQVPVNGSFTYSGLNPHLYQVGLSGVAANCAVIGANPQVVNVVRGATAEVAFAVTCGSGAPSLRVTIATTGGDLDVDGYRVNVLGFGFQDGAPVNGAVPFYFVPPGAYQVELQDIASNCAVSGANPRGAAVQGSGTAELAFAVACNSVANGSIRVTVVTNGEDLDPDGYYVQLVGYAYGSNLPVNGSFTYPIVQPGGYSVELTGLATNCVVSGANPKPVTVTIGATADATFSVTCVRLE
jgi:hypothetical protein